MKVFAENLIVLFVSYTGDKIFNMPTLKTVKEFCDSWDALNAVRNSSYVDYIFTVEEDETEVLFNVIGKTYADVARQVSIITIVTETFDQVNPLYQAKSPTLSSLRATLSHGYYVVRFLISMKECQSWRGHMYSKSSEKDKNNFFFRFAASKEIKVFYKPN